MRVSRILIGLGIVAAAALAVFLVGPRAVGGPAEYVITQGSSMQPKLEQGDLVVLRGADSYRPGDVVAYRSGRLGRVVLHRIVGVERGRFVTKGDNNDWHDADRPTQSDVIGRMWFAVPNVGTLLGALRTPRTFAFVAALLTLLAVAGTGAGVERRRRRRRREGERPRRRFAPSRAWIALGAAGLAVAGAAFVAFTTPVTRPADALVGYRQSGAFAYSAKTRPSPVYAGRTVKTGDPVFLRLVDRLPVRYAYALESDALREVRGTTRLTAELSDEGGWRRVVSLGPAATFAGPNASANGTVDLRAVWNLLRRVQAATGVRRESYVLTLMANVDVRGTLSETPVHERFAQRVAFRLDSLKLELVSDAAPSVNAAARFRSERGGSITVTRLQPATIALLGRGLRVPTARRLAAGAAALWLVALIAVALRSRPAHEPARIRSRYASLLVPVTAEAPHATVEVATIEALVKVAESAGRVILHRELDGAHSYVVDDDGPVYRYRAYESEEAQVAEALREHAHGNGNGNGHHAPERHGFLAQLLER